MRSLLLKCGLGHSSKDRYVKYKGKKKTHKLLWQGAVVTDLSEVERLSEKGMIWLAWVHGSSTAASFPVLHRLIIRDQSLLSRFMPLSPLISLWLFLLWCSSQRLCYHPAQCTDFRYPACFPTKSITSCLTFRSCHVCVYKQKLSHLPICHSYQLPL